MFGRGRMRGRRAGIVLAGGSSGEAAVVPLSFFLSSRGRFPVAVPLALSIPVIGSASKGVSSAKPRNVSPVLLASTFSLLFPTPSYGSPASGSPGASHTPSS
ncbi:hypothetical protein MRX96_024553 [Rhipicephalus microplus]